MALPFRVEEIDHVVFRCRDQARMLEFYSGVLGLAEFNRVPHNGIIQLRAGRGVIDLVPAPGERDAAARNVDHVCLRIDTADIGAAMGYLRERGIEAAGEPVMRGDGVSFFIRDPEGNRIELKRALPPA